MRALLGVRTHFSFHWGTVSPKAWLGVADQLGYGYIGFADHASFAALPEIVRFAGECRVRPLYGVSFPFADGSAALGFALDADGYGNLAELTTRWLDRAAAHPVRNGGGVPLLDPGVAGPLFSERRGLSGIVFCVNNAGAFAALRGAGAEAYWRVGPTLKSPPGGIAAGEAAFAPGPSFASPGEFEAHRLLRAIGAATTLDRIPGAEFFGRGNPAPPIPMAVPGEYVREPEAYRDRFSVYAGAIGRADALAERLARFDPSRETIFPPVPEAAASGETPIATLRRLAYEGAAVRYGGVTAEARKRLEHELALIGRKGFAEYFLVVHDIVNRVAGGDSRVRRGRSVTCGRGSGAASLVNYCLGVTNVDALKHNLMFERFLNEARFDPPDIDVDFAWDERDGVMEKVFADYGRARVARVANHNRYDWRGAFRAAARALGLADAEITRHLRESPSVYAAPPANEAPDPEGAPATSRARKLRTLERGRDSAWSEAARLAGLIEDMPHCFSMHCGGVVMSPGPIARAAPTLVSRKGLPTIQWEKDGAEDMGLVKVDLLGNRSLAVIRDAVRAVAAEEGVREDEVIRGDPEDDPATRALVATGNTFGVFYLESPAMRLLMAKAGVGDFAHAVVHSSIIRPAANAFINEYLERLKGKPWEPEHERLRGLFDESYGIPVYQEDVVKLAMALCDYDYARADGLRKCLGKHDAKERIAAQFPDLEAAARANGVDDGTIRRFWDTLMSMTGYSFCKPHSASFARVSYEACYLRAHHPAHFIAAVISNGGGFYSLQAYVSEAMRLGLAVFGPDVNRSGNAWRAEGRRAVRTGLMSISGLARNAIAAVVEERSRNGPYAGLADFLARVPLHMDDFRRLGVSGALDSLAPELNRPQIVWLAARSAREREEGRDSGGGGTGSLFDSEPAHRGAGKPPSLPGYTERQRLEMEYAALGFIPGRHPLALFRDDIRRDAERLCRERGAPLARMAEIPARVGKTVTTLAWPVSAKVVETKHGDAMMFQSFEDDRSLCEAVIFPREFQRFHRLLGAPRPLWVTGRVEEEFGVATLRVVDVRCVMRNARCAINREPRNAEIAGCVEPGFSPARLRQGLDVETPG